MLRAVKWILVVAVLLVVAWWIGGLPGTVTAQSGDYTVEISVPAALLILFLIAAFFTIVLRVLSGIRRVPGGLSTWRGGRRQRLGEIAVRRGVVALAAGDAETARGQAGQARKLLGDAPLALLLSAESARLSGQTAAARAAFLQLTKDKDMAFLGHRGLLRHSITEGDLDTALNHARAAETAYPGSPWLRAKRLDIAVQRQDWRSALALTREPAQIAALATAAARASTDKQQALAYAKQAVRADPALAPAVVAYAASLLDLGKPSAAKRALLAGWAAAPNPLIAETYLEPVPTPIERAQAAAELARANPGHMESELVLGETALSAQLTGEARRHGQAAIAAGADDGRAQNILATLDGKPASAATHSGWVCGACHVPASVWAPACPQCGRVGSLTWKSVAALV